MQRQRQLKVTLVSKRIWMIATALLAMAPMASGISNLPIFLTMNKMGTREQTKCNLLVKFSADPLN